LHRRDISETHRALKQVSEEFSKVTATLNGTAVDPSALTAWLLVHHPEHSYQLHNPPQWVKVHCAKLEGWKTVGDKTWDESVRTHYGLWVKGIDLDLLEPLPLPQHVPDPPPASIQRNSFAVLGVTEEESPTSSRPYIYHNDLVEWFVKHGFKEMPPVPQGDRSLVALLCDDNVWNMSRSERSTLCKYWESETCAYNHESNVAIFDNLRQKHPKLQADLDAYNTEVIFLLWSCFFIHGSLP